MESGRIDQDVTKIPSAYCAMERKAWIAVLQPEATSVRSLKARLRWWENASMQGHAKLTLVHHLPIWGANGYNNPKNVWVAELIGDYQAIPEYIAWSFHTTGFVWENINDILVYSVYALPSLILAELEDMLDILMK